MKMKYCIWLLPLLVFSQCCWAQEDDTDSLKSVISSLPENDNKVNLLLRLSKNFLNDDPNHTIEYAKEAMDLATKINFEKGIALALKDIGLGYYVQGKYLETLEYWQKSLQTFDKMNDSANIARLLSNIGAVYFNNGDDSKALEYHLKSLRVAEKIMDTLRIVTAMNNIGVVYMNKSATHGKAMQYFLKAVPLSELSGDKPAIGTSTVNLGELYFDSGDHEKALFYFQKSLEAYKNSVNITYSLNSIGKLYTSQGNYKLAKEFHERALGIATKLSARQDMVISLLGLAGMYMKQENYTAALSSYKQAEPIAKEINAGHELKNTYEGLALTYSKLSDYSHAYNYQTLLTGIKDTLYNVESDKKMLGLQFDFEIQKKEGQITLLQKDKDLQELNIKREKLTKNALLAGFGLILIIAFILLRNYRSKVKVNKILDQQNAEIQHLILNVLPAEVADELQKNGHATPKYYESVSVMFTDIVGFTKIADTLSAQEVVAELNDVFIAFDQIIEKYDLEKIKTIGDSYMCAGGIPRNDELHAVKIVRAALDIREYMAITNEARKAAGASPWELRIGIHSGPVVAGVVGKNKYAYDIWGSTVNIASRMESNGQPGQINISASAYELVKENYDCTHRGKIFAKNVGEIDMYFVKEKQNSILENPQEIFDFVNLKNEKHIIDRHLS
ncbi:MAG: tetratricopeptide repeat protein [Chitinophagaceae bacterium]|nr:tetratricopeptide repeat protein [Chitinophagaceae bacterium]